MSDIVERLRTAAAAADHAANAYEIYGSIQFLEAAAEIERLRRLIDEWVPKSEQARAALRGKVTGISDIMRGGKP